jgi:hypothetical protein
MAGLAIGLSASAEQVELPRRVLVDHAFLLDVSPAQDFLLYMTGADEGHCGDVWVAFLPSKQRKLLHERECPPRLVGQTVIGNSWIWAPGFESVWYLPAGPGWSVNGGGVRVSPDGRTLLYYRETDRSSATANRGLADRLSSSRGALELVRVDQCTKGHCSPETLLTGIREGDFITASDVRFVASKTEDGVVLLDVAAGRSITVRSPTPAHRADTVRFSPDSSTLLVHWQESPKVSCDEPRKDPYDFSSCRVESHRETRAVKLYSATTGLVVPWPAVEELVPVGVSFFDDDTLTVLVDRDEGYTVFRVTPFDAVEIARPKRGYVRGDWTVGIWEFLDPLFSWDAIACESRRVVPREVDVEYRDDALDLIVFADESARSRNSTRMVLARLSDGKEFHKFETCIAAWAPYDRGRVSKLEKGTGALVYLEKNCGEPGRLYVWRDGVATLVADGVNNFQSRSSPDTLYFSATRQSARSQRFPMGEIRSVPLP